MRTSLVSALLGGLLLLSAGCAPREGTPVLIRDVWDYEETLTRVQERTKDPLARWRQGQELSAAEKEALRDALPFVEGLIAFSPNKYGPHYIRGMIFDAQGRRDDAERAYLQALRLPPENKTKDDETVFALCYFDLAKIRFDAGKYEIADEAISQSLALRPDNPEFQVMGASIAVQRGDKSRARSLLDQALKTDPENPRARDLMRLLDLAEKP